jgi:hypothetical protein
MNKEVLTEYSYTGITGNVYHPEFVNGHWYLPPTVKVSFWHMLYLCNVPEDEALILKLKYSGANA